MNQKTQMTKQILAESLKKLLPHHSFEKITIKDITDAAGFIRPTFYNHFKDKYDLVEWIFTEEVIRPGEQLFDVGLFREGIRLMLANMEKEKDFYVRAVKIQGQNSFRDIVFQSFVTLIQKVFAKHTPFPETVPHFFRPEILAGVLCQCGNISAHEVAGKRHAYFCGGSGKSPLVTDYRFV